MIPAISYIICSVQRSGTHLLSSILRGTGVAGRPGEYLVCKRTETWEQKWNSPSRIAYIERVRRQGTTANGVFGLIMMWTYFERAIGMLREIPAYQHLSPEQVLPTVFSQPKYIWLRRRDRLEQAISWAIASQTKVWSQKPGEAPQPDAAPRFDFEAIDQHYNHITDDEQNWADYFGKNKLQPLVLFYEDVTASHRATAERVLEFLGVPIPKSLEVPAPAVEKQASTMSEDWAARYLELKAKTGAQQ
ncbi:MAG TPA: Stf0 family sulfotransferase [Chthoniobacterales bacterium]|jgi:LPS sulfotransferase NodH